MKGLKVGMIGAGWVSRYHLRGWQPQSHQAKVVAIADPDAEALRTRAAEFGIPATYADAESLIDGASPDILDICAPREFHADLVRLAAGRGIPAICQKPLARNLGEAERLIADVGNRVPIMVHENWRFRKYYRRIAELLGSHAVGEIRHAQLEFLSSGMIAGADGKRPALVRQPFLRTLDRMLVAEVLIHHLDTLRFLLGELEVVSVRIMRSNEEIAGEDGAAVALRRRGDSLPVHVVANLAVHGHPPRPSDRLRIVGSDGTILLDRARLQTWGRLVLEEYYDPDATYQDSYNSTIAHFVDGLRRGRPFETAPDDNLKTLAIVEAIYEAGRPAAA